MPESLVVCAIFRELMKPPPVVLSRSKNKSYEETGQFSYEWLTEMA